MKLSSIILIALCIVIGYGALLGLTLFLGLLGGIGEAILGILILVVGTYLLTRDSRKENK